MQKAERAMSGAHHDLIFRHEGNARAAASVILIGVLAALIGSVFMAIGPKFKQEPRFTRDTATGPMSAPVRVVGSVPRENVACAHQVWPNIDQRCLVRTDSGASPDNTSPPQQSVSPPTATIGTTAVQSSPTSGSNAIWQSTASAPSERNTFYVKEPAELAVSLPEDDDQLDQPLVSEPPRKRMRRHHRNSFHLNFGGFRF